MRRATSGDSTAPTRPASWGSSGTCTVTVPVISGRGSLLRSAVADPRMRAQYLRRRRSKRNSPRCRPCTVALRQSRMWLALKLARSWRTKTGYACAALSAFSSFMPVSSSERSSRRSCEAPGPSSACFSAASVCGSHGRFGSTVPASAALSAATRDILLAGERVTNGSANSSASAMKPSSSVSDTNDRLHAAAGAAAAAAAPDAGASPAPTAPAEASIRFGSTKGAISWLLSMLELSRPCRSSLSLLSSTSSASASAKRECAAGPMLSVSPEARLPRSARLITLEDESELLLSDDIRATDCVHGGATPMKYRYCS
eukprot:Rhum_TRINITY_DN8718_c1_g1::Rhum_TRINITY_DN8718_c1_g1_i1::g.29648::m.29648